MLKERKEIWNKNWNNFQPTLDATFECFLIFLKPHSHRNGFYWGHQCSWTLTPANRMQAKFKPILPEKSIVRSVASSVLPKVI